jgi:hypothetical protein
VDDTRSERIAKAEEGLAEMQTALEQAKRAARPPTARSESPIRLPSKLVRSQRRSRSSSVPLRP